MVGRGQALKMIASVVGQCWMPAIPDVSFRQFAFDPPLEYKHIETLCLDKSVEQQN